MAKRKASALVSAASALPRDKWVSAKVKITRGGKIVAKIPAVRRKANVAAGFVDEEGIFHPIRASYDYSPSLGGDKAPKAKRKKAAKAKKKNKPAVRKKNYYAAFNSRRRRK